MHWPGKAVPVRPLRQDGSRPAAALHELLREFGQRAEFVDDTRVHGRPQTPRAGRKTRISLRLRDPRTLRPGGSGPGPISRGPNYHYKMAPSAPSEVPSGPGPGAAIIVKVAVTGDR